MSPIFNYFFKSVGINFCMYILIRFNWCNGYCKEEPAYAEASAGKEEKVVEGEETGLGWLLAAIGDLFRLENLWWFLLLLIIIIIILFLLSCKKKRKEE